MVSTSANVLVGLPLDEGASMELLSWAVGVAAHQNDTVVALHVLDSKDDKKADSKTIDTAKMRRAKAFVISMLGEFTALSQSKQVNLEAKIMHSSSVGKGLIEEAKFLEAGLLVVGSSRNRAQRTSLQITKYCFEHAPEGCSVIAIRKRAQTQQDSNADYTPSEGFCKVNNKGCNKENCVEKQLSPPSKDSISKTKKENSFNKTASAGNRHSPTESISEKPSPRTVFAGPEEETGTIDDCSSIGDSTNIECATLASKLSESGLRNRAHRRSNTWKNLPLFKLLSPFLHSTSGRSGKQNDGWLSDEKGPRPSWRCFSYDEISQATNNFHPDNMVGQGGFSEVYRGDLCDGQTIAVKKLSKENTDEKEFLTELGIIGHVCHPNTSYLIGCCIDNGFHLIFNFCPNGSLSSALHGKNGTVLKWAVRYNIVVGIARGLHYLHKCCKRRIIHRDIKASNVLLGPDFEAQISDFGLAKWLPTQWTHHSVIPIEGTFGYLAPEYFMHGIVDEKTDVYSFGVLLLEIITGRRPVDGSKENLLLWAKPLIETGNITELADPKLEGKYDINQIHRLVLIASYCIRQSSIWRPSMSEVLQLITDGDDSELTQSWTMSEYKDDEADDSTTDDIDCNFLNSYTSDEDY